MTKEQFDIFVSKIKNSQGLAEPKTKLEILEEEKSSKEASLGLLVSAVEELQKKIDSAHLSKKGHTDSIRNINDDLKRISEEIAAEKEEKKGIRISDVPDGWYKVISPNNLKGMKILVSGEKVFVDPEGATDVMKRQATCLKIYWSGVWGRKIK